MQRKKQKNNQTRKNKWLLNNLLMVNKPTKESIIKILNNISLDDKTLEEVHNIIKVDPLHVGLLSEHLEKLEFEEHYPLAKSLCTMDHAGVIATVIRRTLEEKDLPKQTKFNLINLCRGKGIAISEETFNYLLHFKQKSNGIVGKGETLIRILMKGTPIPSGDIGASGKKLEIKYNRSRLRGMHGFDTLDASQVAITLDKYFLWECSKIGFDATSLIGTEDNRWNFVSGKRKKPYLLAEIIKQSGMDPKIACGWFVAAFFKYFTVNNFDESYDLVESLSLEFKNGILEERNGYSNFIYKMCAFAMKYYAKVEQFDGMLILNDKFECMYITKEFIFSNDLEVLSAFIRNNLQIITPSLTSKAGPQGSSFGISL